MTMIGLSLHMTSSFSVKIWICIDSKLIGPHEIEGNYLNSPKSKHWLNALSQFTMQ